MELQLKVLTNILICLCFVIQYKLFRNDSLKNIELSCQMKLAERNPGNNAVSDNPETMLGRNYCANWHGM